MNAIRHHLVVLAGLIVLALIAGLAPALWVLAALVVTIGISRSTALLMARDERQSIAHLSGIILAITIGGLVAAAGATVWFFLGFGWIIGVAFVVLWLLFFATKEGDMASALREAGRVHADLARLVTARSANAITDDQLKARAEGLLDRRVPRFAHLFDDVAKVLVSSSGLTASQHRQLLELLALHTQRTRPYPISSTLREAIQAATARS
jgi:hypothetical protein